MEQRKICSKCKIEKNIDNFNKDKKAKDGYCYRCRKCSSQYLEKYYLDNKEKLNKQMGEYYLENKEEINKQKNEYRKINKKHLKEKNKEYSMLHADEIKIYQKEWKERPNSKRIIYENHLTRREGIELIDHIDKTELLERNNYICPFKCVCGKNCPYGKLKNDPTTHIAHLSPVIAYIRIGKKAPHSWDNVIPMRDICNMEMHDMFPLEFIWSKIPERGR